MLKFKKGDKVIVKAVVDKDGNYSDTDYKGTITKEANEDGYVIVSHGHKLYKYYKETELILEK